MENPIRRKGIPAEWNRNDEGAGAPDEKRNVPEILRQLLERDRVITERFVFYVSSNFPNLASKSEMKFMEVSCSGFIWLPFSIIMYFLDFLFPRQVAANVLVALIVDIIIIGVLKALVRRRRPAVKKADVFGSIGPDKFSFPSGHASRSILITQIFTQISPLAESGLPYLIVFTCLWTWAFSVCLSRILNGRHYVLDVICGVVVGFFASIVVSSIWMSPESAEAFLNFFREEASADI